MFLVIPLVRVVEYLLLFFDRCRMKAARAIGFFLSEIGCSLEVNFACNGQPMWCDPFMLLLGKESFEDESIIQCGMYYVSAD